MNRVVMRFVDMSWDNIKGYCKHEKRRMIAKAKAINFETLKSIWVESPDYSAGGVPEHRFDSSGENLLLALNRVASYDASGAIALICLSGGADIRIEMKNGGVCEYAADKCEFTTFRVDSGDELFINGNSKGVYCNERSRFISRKEFDLIKEFAVLFPARHDQA